MNNIIMRLSLVVVLLTVAVPSMGQNNPVLHIDTPKNGAVVSAGSSVNIVVSATDPSITN
jgi:hypothetical protein